MYIQQEVTIIISDTTSMLWDQLRLGLESIQIQIGIQDIIFKYPYQKFEFLVANTWIKSQWNFISKYNLKIKNWTSKLRTYREGDCYLMEHFSNARISKHNIRT